MKLQTSIFLRVFLATAVPICFVTLYATMYSERLFRESVDEEIANSLDNIASEVRRRLLLDQDLLSGLSKVPPVQAFLPVLEQIAAGKNPRTFQSQIGRLDQFLSAIQNIASPTSQFQVLDISGNYLAGARDTQQSDIGPALSPDLESPAVGASIGAKAFPSMVARLRPGEIRYILDPSASVDPVTLEPVPLYDMVLALGQTQRPVGYITAKIRYQPIDRLLNVSPRPHQGKLFIAEIDPDDEERDGLVLYDDDTQVSLAGERLQTERLQRLRPRIYELVQRELFGFVDSPDGSVRTYYSEFFPYPDQLLVWVIGIRIDLNALAAPFSRLRIVILSAAALVLITGLALARIGARGIVMPITDLARRLSEFPRGDRRDPIEIRGPDEIRRAGIAFNEMLSSFEQTEGERDQARTQMIQKAKLASVGQLAAGIGHEINNPLHNILTLTKLMNKHHPTMHKGLREDITSVHKEAQRASQIVRALLNFSRETPIEYRRFEVDPWLREVLSLVAQEAKQQGVQILYEQDDEYLLEGDPNLLQQALMNLLINGLQASSLGTEIRVITSVQEDRLFIEVRDEGGGVASDIQDQIFDPFFTTKTSRGGTGLGLSISLGIVTQHGGELSVSNRPGGGVSAVMVLPRATLVQPVIGSAAVGAR